MKYASGLLLACLAGLLMPTPASAGFVFDDFSEAGSIPQTLALATGATRNFSSPSGADGTIAGGVMSASQVGVASNSTPRVRLAYTGVAASSLAPFSGVETFVGLGTVSNLSSDSLTVRGFKNFSNTAGHTDSLTIASGDSADVLFTFTNTGNWTKLLVDFVGVQGKSMDFSVTGPIALSAVPEPTSLALIGCVAAGGGVAGWRRRRRQVAATV